MCIHTNPAGYQLRPGQKCPECGVVIEAPRPRQEPIAKRASLQRDEAIGELAGAWEQRDGEFCAGVCYNEERKRSLARLVECLLALGCTEEEIAGYREEG